jgi:glycosyltransferase involved in cell wall biosynthesis
LLKKNPLLEFVIAGRPDDRHYYRYILDSAAELGVENSIHFAGPVSEREKSWYFHNCKAFIFPSLSEGFGLPVTEAMSLGKPTFLSDRTALPEIGKDAAFYFKDFSEEVLQETFNAGMKQYEEKNMKEQIQARAKNFSWEKAATDYLNIYRSLVQ